MNGLGISVRLLPAQYVRACVRRNKTDATDAPANKLARICYATLRDHAPFGEPKRLNRKITRESFVMPA